MSDAPKFHLLSEDEYARLSTEEKIAYLQGAIAAMQPRKVESLGILLHTSQAPAVKLRR